MKPEDYGSKQWVAYIKWKFSWLRLLRRIFVAVVVDTSFIFYPSYLCRVLYLSLLFLSCSSHFIPCGAILGTPTLFLFLSFVYSSHSLTLILSLSLYLSFSLAWKHIHLRSNFLLITRFFHLSCLPRIVTNYSIRIIINNNFPSLLIRISVLNPLSSFILHFTNGLKY